MTHLEPIRCTDCAGTKICKNGHSRNGTQRWLCQDKGCATRSFQREYRYVGYWAGVSGRIGQMTLSGSRVADICRMLGASKNKVISDLKKKRRASSTPTWWTVWRRAGRPCWTWSCATAPSGTSSGRKWAARPTSAGCGTS